MQTSRNRGESPNAFELTSLGEGQLRAGLSDEAVCLFEQAVRLAPDHVPALEHLGRLYEHRGEMLKAAHYHSRAFVLPPFDGKSWDMLGKANYILGRLPEAAEAYRSWLHEDPSNPVAAHMLAASSGEDLPARASDNYLVATFNDMADRFDAKDGLHNSRSGVLMR